MARMMNARPVAIKRTIDEVAARIQARILDGSFAPGARLPAERELALQLRVNRSSVREALKKLEQLRLVDIQRGSGARVQDSEHASFEVVFAMLGDGPPDPARIRDLLELREVLLPGLLRLAIERASDAELESCVAGLRRVAGSESSDDEFLAGLSELHVAFARMTHNRVILILANSVTRFLAEREPLRDLGTFGAERRKLRPLLQRLAVAISARDSDTASRSGRDVLRRVAKLVEAEVRA
jgi:GntR family transcriptional repressor for pyruvate dehydrogenase complex